MENATKALLIAAAILIAILLIAFGMQIMSSSSETGKQASDTGAAISNQTTSATSSALTALNSVGKWTNK